jgi:hypothetical protein
MNKSFHLGPVGHASWTNAALSEIIFTGEKPEKEN